MTHLDNQTVQLIIVAAVAVALLLQALAFLGMLIIARMAVRTVQEKLDDMRISVMGVVEKVEPIIDNVRDVVAHSGPKIESTVADVAAMSQNLRRQTNDVQVAATELIEKLRRQSDRVDTMLTRVMDVVDRASGYMTGAVSKPVRQLSALLASAKAVVEALRHSPHDGHGAHVHVDHAHQND